ncbi:MAG: hypothetical protein OXT65_11865 [Alphaproteobacteria bacterium]|nr:hypothetical protein [Alphaproteobacteria bacterium]
MKLALRNGFLCVAVLFLSGCAAKQAAVPAPRIAEKSYQSIQVSTPGSMGAECTLETAAAHYRLVTPGSITVERTSYPMTVSCMKGEHFRGHVVLEPRRVREAGNVVNHLYPYSVAVPLGLNMGSLKANVTRM